MFSKAFSQVNRWFWLGIAAGLTIVDGWFQRHGGFGYGEFEVGDIFQYVQYSEDSRQGGGFGPGTWQNISKCNKIKMATMKFPYSFAHCSFIHKRKGSYLQYITHPLQKLCSQLWLSGLVEETIQKLALRFPRFDKTLISDRRYKFLIVTRNPMGVLFRFSGANTPKDTGNWTSLL